MYEFEWDPAKNASNSRKHGINFELAYEVFFDPLSHSELDRDYDTYEERWKTMGRTRDGRLLMVCHTWTETVEGRYSIRLISARPADGKERQRYESDE